jgi:hypothetical protein
VEAFGNLPGNGSNNLWMRMTENCGHVDHPIISIGIVINVVQARPLTALDKEGIRVKETDIVTYTTRSKFHCSFEQLFGSRRPLYVLIDETLLQHLE